MNIFGVNGILLLATSVLKIESWLLALACWHKILINAGVNELVDVRHRDDARLFALTLVGEECLEVLIVHKLVAILGSSGSRSGAGSLVFEHGCDTKLFKTLDGTSIWTLNGHLTSIHGIGVGILESLDCANWLGEAHITESKCR